MGKQPHAGSPDDVKNGEVGRPVKNVQATLGGPQGSRDLVAVADRSEQDLSYRSARRRIGRRVPAVGDELVDVKHADSVALKARCRGWGVFRDGISILNSPDSQKCRPFRPSGLLERRRPGSIALRTSVKRERGVLGRAPRGVTGRRCQLA